MTLLKERFERMLEYNRSKLKDLPEGTLITNISKGLKYLYWSRYSKSIPGKRERVPLKESDRQLVEELRQQRLIRIQNPLYEHNINAINRFLKTYKPCDDDTCLKMLSSAYNEDLSYQGFDGPNKNLCHPENLNHRNSIGEVFRSRIEVHISELLLSRGVKYDYDVELKLGAKTRYPDFRITHPKTGKFIYLEYFGKMYDEDYAQDNLIKIQEYLKNGYVYGDNLMFFFENSSGIDIAAIARVIDMLIQ